ncbi:hypothetical protein ACFL3S_00515 [Gemmatimonadota bacterium]
MRRSWLVLGLLGSLIPAACGPGQVVVTAEIEVPNPEGEGMVVRPISDTEVELYPFDRDAVFDSLEAEFGVPEPPIPDELLAAQDSIAVAQEAWRAAEARWGSLRDRLQQVTDEMEGLNRGEARYVALYREFQDGEAQLIRVEREKDGAFERFTALQEGIIRQADSIRILRDQWADDAFGAAWDVFAIKLQETGMDLLADTTDAAGIATIEVPPGQWWVHARHELPFQELYWNIPITVVRGTPEEVRLTRETAQIRPKL